MIHRHGTDLTHQAFLRYQIMMVSNKILMAIILKNSQCKGITFIISLTQCKIYDVIIIVIIIIIITIIIVTIVIIIVIIIIIIVIIIIVIIIISTDK